jgi:TolA-binding protein
MKRVLTTVTLFMFVAALLAVVFAPRPAAAADDEHMARMLKMMEQMNAQMNQMQQQMGQMKQMHGEMAQMKQMHEQMRGMMQEHRAEMQKGCHGAAAPDTPKKGG